MRCIVFSSSQYNVYHSFLILHLLLFILRSKVFRFNNINSNRNYITTTTTKQSNLNETKREKEKNMIPYSVVLYYIYFNYIFFGVRKQNKVIILY